MLSLEVSHIVSRDYSNTIFVIVDMKLPNKTKYSRMNQAKFVEGTKIILHWVSKTQSSKSFFFTLANQPRFMYRFMIYLQIYVSYLVFFYWFIFLEFSWQQKHVSRCREGAELKKFIGASPHALLCMRKVTQKLNLLCKNSRRSKCSE